MQQYIPALPFKRVGEAVVIFDSGQSNSGGVYPATFPLDKDIAPNTQIKHWALNEGGDIDDPADYSWQTMDISRAADGVDANGALVGVQGGGAGLRAYFQARVIHEQLDCPVFVFHISKGGTALNAFVSTGGAGDIYDSIQAHWPVATADAALEEHGVANRPADIFSWQHGQSDAGAGIIGDFYSYTFIELFLSEGAALGWYGGTDTYTVLCEPPAAEAIDTFGGIEAAARKLGDLATYVSSKNVPFVLDAAYHFTAEGAKQMGVLAARAALSSPNTSGLPTVFVRDGVIGTITGANSLAVFSPFTLNTMVWSGTVFLACFTDDNTKSAVVRADFIYNTVDNPDAIFLNETKTGDATDLSLDLSVSGFGIGPVLKLDNANASDNWNIRGWVEWYQQDSDVQT